MKQETNDATIESVREWMLRAAELGRQLELTPPQFVAAASLLHEFAQAVLEAQE